MPTPRGVNPPAEPTTLEKVQRTTTVIEHQLYKRAALIASFLTGAIVGYAIGVW